MTFVTTIVSGGQTGADRAALDVARQLSIPYRGWVPAGRWAEDGPIASSYQGLNETPSKDPNERTERNVCDSDATLIVSHGSLTGGSALTREFCEKHGKRCLCIDLNKSDVSSAGDMICAWLAQHPVKQLNVAGPRASEDPEIYDSVRAILLDIFASTRWREKPTIQKSLEKKMRAR